MKFLFKRILNIDLQIVIDNLKLKSYLKRIKADRINVITFLKKMYKYDHLRYLEYPFLAQCLLNNDISNGIIVDLGGAHSMSMFIPVLLQINFSKIISIDVLNIGKKA